MLCINFPHFRFLSCLSKLKATSVQKVFSLAQHHKRYANVQKHFLLINNVRGIVS